MDTTNTKPHDEAKIREALSTLIKAAFGDAKAFTARIPADPDHDADLIVGAAVNELMALRDYLNRQLGGETQAEHKTTGAVPCGECEAKADRINRLIYDVNGAKAERDDLRRQLAEAQSTALKYGEAMLGYQDGREQALADNAALVEALDLMVDAYVPKGHRAILAEYKLHQRNSKDRIANVHACRALSQPHPGAPMLSRMADLERENEGLRKVEEYATHKTTCRAHPMQIWHRYGTASPVIQPSCDCGLDAIRNQEGR